MFTVDKAPQDAAPDGAGGDRRDQLLPRERPRAPARHDRQPPRLVHQPPAQLGRAAAVLPAQGDGRAASAHAGVHRPRGRARRARRRRGLGHARHDANGSGDEADAVHARAATSSTSGSTRARPSSTCCAARTPSGRHDSGPEADLYLEGHDQHRGWFHSSLLIACALEGRAPYRGLLTHGFTVDGQGRKMSKSLGNVIEPQETAKKLGAEIIRLWVRGDRLLRRHRRSTRRSSPAWSTPTAASATRCASCSPTPATSIPRSDAVPLEQMLEIDRWALARAAQLQAEVLAHYEVYEFHPVVAKLQVFCSRGPGRVLPRRAEGPALHHRAEVARAALARRPRCGTSRTRCCAGWRRS